MRIADAGFLTVVQRELREGARRPFNYWLRVAGAAAGAVLLYVINQGTNGNQAAEGLRLFTGLHEMLLVLICVMVPAMSADCIASEKREGTLGLLFLTPLTAMGVVAGKGVVQAFRAFTLWVAVLPVIIIPFLSGGVTGGDVASAVTIEFCVTLLCLAAGLLASTLAKARSTAFVLAACFGVAFVCLFGGLLGFGFLSQTLAPGQLMRLAGIVSSGESLMTGESDGNRFSGWIAGAIMPRVTTPIQGGPAGGYSGSYTMVVNGPYGPIRYTMLGAARPSQILFPSGWSLYFSAPANRDVWRSLLLESLLAVPLLFLLVLWFAARQMERSWHDQPPSLRRESWIKTFCVPLARRRFARQMQETLEWNPIAWLQQYSWKARLSKWGLCLGLVFLECAANATSATGLLDAQYLMLLIFAGAYTFVGVSSFLTEKKTGALELLLVTTVTPGQIIIGRVWGLWKQFLPAGVTLLLLWVYANQVSPSRFGVQGYYADSQNSGILWRLLTSPLTDAVQRSNRFIGFYGSGYYDRVTPNNPAFQIFVTALGFFTLPVFATYFALRVKNLILAAALTWLALFLCPYFAFSALAFLASTFQSGLPQASLYAAVFLSSLAFALLACFLLRHSLSRRIYSF